MTTSTLSAAAEFTLSTEGQELLIAFIRRSENYSAMPDAALPTSEEQEMAEALLALNLPSNDHAPERSYTYSEYVYVKEIQERNALISACGLSPDKVQIRRYNVVFDRCSGPLNVKIIGLSYTDGTPVPNGILFFGRYTHRDGKDLYVHLTIQEAQFLKNRLSK